MKALGKVAAWFVIADFAVAGVLAVCGVTAAPWAVHHVAAKVSAPVAAPELVPAVEVAPVPRHMTVREAEVSVATQVRALSAGRDCWPTGARSVTPRTVLVHDVGSTVVREVSFSVGWAAASRGLVWVDGVCA